MNIPSIETFAYIDPNDVLIGELGIDVLDKVSLLIGLIPPGTIYYGVQTKSVNESLRVEKDKYHVQIHFIANHYIVSCQAKGKITIYDSLPDTSRISSLKPQLESLYYDVKTEDICYCVPQFQGATVDCGLFACANAIMLLKFINPTTVKLDQTKLRSHLKNILTSGTVSLFPTCSSIAPLGHYFTEQLQKLKKDVVSH